ncbi:hypothetical protein LCGC14_1212100 [marine sediment metagenome]|uniref:Radical SAM core domain-containing protein n=1 Tax=marine sediment metagenome TaxID=412755 RepID=A0A0F9LDL4_9ZZZZ
MRAIYETRGRAQEYCPLAVNLYQGCGHGCIYCYGPTVTHQDPEAFRGAPHAREGILYAIDKDARRLTAKGEFGPVLACFITDCYQPLDVEGGLSRKAIEILHYYSMRVTILTKGGKRAERDFDILKPRKGLHVVDTFATSLTLLDEGDSGLWEPEAASPIERMESLRHAHEMGISTWASCEPVIYPEQTLELIRHSHPYVDLFKVGTLNYHEHGKTIDWAVFARQVERLLISLGKNYYLKRDLAKHIGHPEGIRREVS